MTCSKLFSGNLPEISSDIIKNLRNDFNTLYSLALVNRFWCRLAVPLLWEDPFFIKYQENSTHFIDTYFSFLNDNDKNEVKENLKSCKFDSNLQPPLFNYPSLIKTLNFSRMQFHVTRWLHFNNVNKKPYKSLNERRKIRMSNNKKNKDTFIILFNLFIENNASLSNLYVHTSPRNQLFCRICDKILDNPKFISEIEVFSLEYQFFIHSLLQNTPEFESIQTFLLLLTSAKRIKHINISTDIVEFGKNFTNIIQSQTKLSSIKTKLLQIPLLNSLKRSSNTLTSINFSECHFSNIMEFDALYYLTQLESLQFKNCKGLNSKVFQPFLNATSLKIKTFVFTNNVIEEFTPIQLFIQKIGPYLKNLVLDVYNGELRGKLFDTIIDFCEKIKFLHLHNIDLSNIPQLPKMIFKLENYLKYLTLEVKFKYGYNAYHRYNPVYDDEKGLKVSSMVLGELSKSLPPSLHYLDLNLVINPNDLKDFFEKCKRVELKKLLIRNRNMNSIFTTLKVIRDFVKESNLEFLAYNFGIFLSGEREDLEKEIRSLIKMMKYNDLVIKVSEIDGKLMIS